MTLHSDNGRLDELGARLPRRLDPERLQFAGAFTFWGIVAALLFGWLVVHAEEPRIYLITFFQEDYVLIHFDTEPNRTYVLRSTDSAPNPINGFQGAHWSNRFTAPAFPFPNHFVFTDTRNAPHRFYRLTVTP